MFHVRCVKAFYSCREAQIVDVCAPATWTNTDAAGHKVLVVHK